MKDKYLNIVTGVLVLVLIILTLILVFFKKNIMDAQVVYISDRYMIVDSDKKKGINVKTNTSDYKLDDSISIYYQGFIWNKTISPKKIKVTNRTWRDTLEESNNVSEAMEENNTASEMEQTNNNIIEETSVSNNNEVSPTVTYSEDDVINYYQEDIDENTPGFKEKVKEKFISIVDFIFYDKEVYGYTFKGLTSSAKMKILELALKLDDKIDKYEPGYKDTIKDKYSNIKEKIIAKAYEIKTSICAEDEDTCRNASAIWEKIKNTSKVSWSVVREYLGIGLTNLREWWREFSGKN